MAASTQKPTTSPAPAAAPAPASVPGGNWPGAFGIYKRCKQAIRRNPTTFSLLFIFYIIFGVVGGDDNAPLLALVSTLGYLFILGGIVYTSIESVRGNLVNIGEALDKCLRVWLKMIGVTLLTGLALALSLLLLIVPFFFVLPRLSLVQYYAVDGMGVIDAFKATWEATKGHATKAYGIYGVNPLIVLLFVTIIGIPFAIYFYIMYVPAFAVLYQYLHDQTKMAPVQVADKV